jgi:polysaccharide pyruvyl transferase WcaK-like protein
MRCVLIGNYGVGNFGDEALREYFLRRFPDIRWTVLSARPGPGELPRIPAGIRSFFGTPWMRTLAAIRQSDAVVFGGGTLFTDSESSRACVIWWLHAAAARWYGRPLLLAFQGIGPFRWSGTERLARQALGWSMFISIRDDQSAARVAGWGSHTKYVRTFDPILSLLAAEKPSTEHKNCLVVIPRRNSAQTLTEAALHEAKSGMHVRLVSFQPDDAGERNYMGGLARQLRAEVRTVRTAGDLRAVMQDATLVLTERFHGAIAAMAYGIPLRIISAIKGDKLDALRTQIRDSGEGELMALVAAGENALRVALEGCDKS